MALGHGGGHRRKNLRTPVRHSLAEIMDNTDPDRKSTVKLHRKLDRPLVLVGLMGAGKTTIGRRLAARLGVPFVDTDAEIEAAAGRTVSEIFADFGEAEFRQGERRVIARLLKGEPRVLATGGGAFIDPKTRARIKEVGRSVWLKAPVELLLERTARRNTRPLLNTGDPRLTLERLARERYPIYAEADITVESGSGPHDNVVDAIIRALNDAMSAAS